MLFRRVGHQRRNRHTVADAEDIRRYRIIGFFLVEDVLPQPRAARPLYFFGNEMPAKPPLHFLVIHLRARHDRWIAMD